MLRGDGLPVRDLPHSGQLRMSLRVRTDPIPRYDRNCLHASPGEKHRALRRPLHVLVANPPRHLDYQVDLGAIVAVTPADQQVCVRYLIRLVLGELSSLDGGIEQLPTLIVPEHVASTDDGTEIGG